MRLRAALLGGHSAANDASCWAGLASGHLLLPSTHAGEGPRALRQRTAAFALAAPGVAPGRLRGGCRRACVRGAGCALASQTAAPAPRVISKRRREALRQASEALRPLPAGALRVGALIRLAVWVRALRLDLARLRRRSGASLSAHSRRARCLAARRPLALTRCAQRVLARGFRASLRGRLRSGLPCALSVCLLNCARRSRGIGAAALRPGRRTARIHHGRRPSRRRHQRSPRELCCSAPATGHHLRGGHCAVHDTVAATG